MGRYTMFNSNVSLLRAVTALSTLACLFVLFSRPAVSAQGQGGSNGIAHRLAALEALTTNLQSALDAEIARATAAEAALQDLLDDEVARAQAAENALADRDTWLEHNITVLRSVVDDHATQLSALGVRVADVEEKTQYIVVDGTDMCIIGANLCIRNGAGNSWISNGLGNLILGYNENSYSAGRTGSHNLVVGYNHEYSSFGGILGGMGNTSSGPFASVLGGVHNEAGHPGAVVCGGERNSAFGHYSVVGGGFLNVSSGLSSVVSGGFNNLASGDTSVVGGGVSVIIVQDHQWGAGTGGSSYSGNFRTP